MEETVTRWLTLEDTEEEYILIIQGELLRRYEMLKQRQLETKGRNINRNSFICYWGEIKKYLWS